MAKDKDRSRILSRIMSRFKDQVEGIDSEENDIYSFAVKVLDEDLLRVLINKKHAWQENRHKFGCEGLPYVCTKEFEEIIKKQTTLNAHNMAHSKNWAMLRYAVSNAEDPDIASTKLVKWLIDYVDNTEGKDVTQIYMAGQQGAGKTEFAFLIAELWLMQNPEGRILTNVRNVDDTIHIEGRDHLQEWLDENEGTPFFVVFDEMNKHAHGDDHQKVMKQLFGLITYLRKKKGNYAILGHTGTDIHPAIRDLCDYIYKESKKVAKIYKSVDESGEGVDPIKTIRGIPTSTLNPDTFDESDWEWSDENIRQCIGTTKDGDRCGAVTRSEWDQEPELFCDAHQNQDEPHPDVPEADLIDTEFEGYFGNEEDAEDDEIIEETTEGNADNSESSTSSEPQNGSDSVDAEEDTEQADEKERSEQVDQGERDVDDVPAEFWTLIEEKTGGAYNKETVDELETFEKILNETEWDELCSQIN